MAMRVELTGHQVDISPGLRNLVDRKIAKVLRVLNDAAVSAGVVVKKERVHNVVEITLHARGERFLHAVGKADTWQAAMTAAVAKVLHQTEKVKGLWQERKRRGEAARSVKTPRRARKAAARKTSPVTGSTTAGTPKPVRTRKQR
jgi:ribosomal subunit interface protein